MTWSEAQLAFGFGLVGFIVASLVVAYFIYDEKVTYRIHCPECGFPCSELTERNAIKSYYEHYAKAH